MLSICSIYYTFLKVLQKCPKCLQMFKCFQFFHGTSQFPKYQTMSKISPLCSRYFQFLRVFHSVENTSHFPKYVYFVQDTSQFPKYLPISAIYPIVQNISQCPKYINNISNIDSLKKNKLNFHPISRISEHKHPHRISLAQEDKIKHKSEENRGWQVKTWGLAGELLTSYGIVSGIIQL